MLQLISMCLGAVLVIEGLVLVLVSSRLDDLLQALRAIPPATLRLIGFGSLAAGAVLTSWAISLG